MPPLQPSFRRVSAAVAPARLAPTITICSASAMERTLVPAEPLSTTAPMTTLSQDIIRPMSSWRAMRVLAPGRLAAAALLVFTTLTAPAANASEAPFVEDSELFQQKTEGYSCFRIPAVVHATNGDVLAFAEGRVADCGDDGDIDIVLRRSTDGG